MAVELKSPLKLSVLVSLLRRRQQSSCVVVLQLQMLHNREYLCEVARLEGEGLVTVKGF